MVDGYSDKESLDEEQYDTTLKSTEFQKEAQEEVYDDTPNYSAKDDLYSLFWKVIKTKDSSKVANLDKYELGSLNISVRSCQEIAVLCELLGRIGIAQWLRNRGEVILATSSSKRGWFTELFVTAKKFSLREKKGFGSSEELQQNQPKKWSFFKK